MYAYSSTPNVQYVSSTRKTGVGVEYDGLEQKGPIIRLIAVCTGYRAPVYPLAPSGLNNMDRYQFHPYLSQEQLLHFWGKL